MNMMRPARRPTHATPSAPRSPQPTHGFKCHEAKGKALAVVRFNFFLSWGEAGEDLRDLLGHFARLSERLKLFVNVRCVSLLTRADSTDDDKLLLFVDSVDHAVSRKFVLPEEI